MQRSISREKWVETLVVADTKMVEFHGSANVEKYVLTVMNMVSARPAVLGWGWERGTSAPWLWGVGHCMVQQSQRLRVWNIKVSAEVFWCTVPGRSSSRSLALLLLLLLLFFLLLLLSLLLPFLRLFCVCHPNVGDYINK